MRTLKFTLPILLALALPARGHAQSTVQTPCGAIPSGYSAICASALTITASLPLAQVGVPYAAGITGNGASPTFAIVSGAATQNGLTMNVLSADCSATGTPACVTGTPTSSAGGTWVIDYVSGGRTSQEATINIGAGSLSTVVISPSTVQLSQGATQQFTAQANFNNQTIYAIPNSSVTWSDTGCPSGSSISSSGLFTASSSATGSCSPSGTWNSVTGTASVTVESPASPVSIQTTSLPNGQIDQLYPETPFGQGVQLVATGGTAPYTWTVTTGSLPTGLTLSSGGLISGTPTTSGSGSSFVVTATDSASHTATRTFSSGITVASLSSLTVAAATMNLSPNTSTTASVTGNYSDSSSAPLAISTNAAAITCSSQFSTTTSGNIQFPTPCATTTGETAVAFVNSWYSGACSGSTMGVTSSNETFSAATTASGQSGTPPPYVNCGQVFYAQNITGNSADQPTATISGSGGFNSGIILYLSGVATSSVLDAHPTPTQDTTGTATTCTPTSFSTAQADEIILGFCNPNNASTWSAPTGYTNYATDTGGSFAVYDAIVNATQSSIAPAETFSPTNPENSFIISLKANSAPTGDAYESANSNSACVSVSGPTIIALPVKSSCSATITYEANVTGSATGTVTINNVVSNVDTGIVISPASQTTAVGGTQTFSATGNVSGNTYSVSWGSSNTAVVTLNPASGTSTTATCAAAGSANIVATSATLGTAQATLTCVSSGSGTLITAAGCTQAQVSAAWNQMSSGAYIVSIPSGTCVWTGNLTLTVPSGITGVTLEGNTTVTCTGTAGTSSWTCSATDNTVIEDGINSATPSPLTINTGSAAFRMTGITIEADATSGKNQGIVDFYGTTSSFRVDHVHEILTGSDGQGFEIDGQITGVFDHDVLDLGNASSYTNGIRVYNDLFDLAGGGNGDGGFEAPTDWGSANFIYLESSQINGGYTNDCFVAGRMVERYNMLVNTQGAMQAHGTKDYAGPQRSCRAEEFYHNYINTNDTFAVLGGQGGTWMVWGNTVANTGTLSWFMANETYRSCMGCNGAPSGAFPPNGWGQCGTDMNYPGNPGTDSPWDGNSNTTTGYPCIDNMGRGQQAEGMNGANFPNRANTTTGTQTWPQQYLEPIYAWMNTLPSGLYTQESYIGDSSTQNGRDIIYDNQSFNGTSGTGYGLTASRPSTCTAGPGGTYGASPTGSYGVAYWATDANNGVGELYVCTSTNTWTGVYEPYTYPHPLDTGN